MWPLRRRRPGGALVRRSGTARLRPSSPRSSRRCQVSHALPHSQTPRPQDTQPRGRPRTE
eukprot:scaffold13056_cov101-Isochrysis_galbana.AAC.2